MTKLTKNTSRFQKTESGFFNEFQRIIINTVLNKKTDIFYAHIDRL